jgi:hypothetical protein
MVKKEKEAENNNVLRNVHAFNVCRVDELVQ